MNTSPGRATLHLEYVRENDLLSVPGRDEQAYSTVLVGDKEKIMAFCTKVFEDGSLEEVLVSHMIRYRAFHTTRHQSMISVSTASW